jgi:hypothetical protein
LKINDEIWYKSKSSDTAVQLPLSISKMAWNNSDLTYDDLLRISNLYRGYFITLIREEIISGENCWKLELNPKPSTLFPWGRINYWVSKNGYLPVLMHFYSERGILERSMLFDEIKKMDGRKIPTKITIKNETKPGYFTEFIYLNVEFGEKIPDKIFSFTEDKK